ncbi:hypothetical protein D623_10009711 [Myotis brandtii]|uniref:Uncharacterized protein n=1 Tax=Myotis brandtii TaxID=109478 RepID=S7PFD9_MYOBR|nr:hypothetical protein D623_10009711 [Myotis brandtii]
MSFVHKTSWLNPSCKILAATDSLSLSHSGRSPGACGLSPAQTPAPARPAHSEEEEGPRYSCRTPTASPRGFLIPSCPQRPPQPWAQTQLSFPEGCPLLRAPLCGALRTCPLPSGLSNFRPRPEA